MGERSAIRAKIVGRVQGVFYRATVRTEARALGLSGWVRNCPDGSVEIEASGPRAMLESLIQALWRGSAASEVEAVEVSWLDSAPEHSGFDVRR